MGREDLFVPGTVRLVDVSHTLHNVRRRGDSDIVLLPQPSDDPNDPLNWSKWRKEYHFWLLWFWGFIAAAGVNWSGPIWTQFTIDLNTTYTQLNISSALCFLFLGIGCVILQPTAMKIGRRPVYIAGTIFNIIGCSLGGIMHTVQLYYAVNILTGFGASPVDSLVEISTTDIFFAHERGTRLSLYIFTIYAGSYLGPVAAGYIDEAQGWRWCSWYLTIFFGVLLVLQFFTLEESNFRRPETSYTVEGVPVSSSTQDHEEKHPSEKTMALPQDSQPETTPPPTNVASRPKSLRQRMAIFDTTHNDPRSWFVIASQPFALCVLPAVTWAGVVYGVQIMWLSLLATTQSEIFTAPPYNFSDVAVGDTNFAALIGGVFGMFWGGAASDYITLHLSRKNDGILEPEFRLWAMIPPALINTAGLLMYGLGAYNGEHWMVSAGLGTAFIGFGIGSGGAIAITYAVDCYPRIASESLVLMLFIRNMIGTGFTFGIQPWLVKDGLKNTSIIMAVVCFVANMSFLVFIFWGKAFRRWTASFTGLISR